MWMSGEIPGNRKGPYNQIRGPFDLVCSERNRSNLRAENILLAQVLSASRIPVSGDIVREEYYKTCQGGILDV